MRFKGLDLNLLQALDVLIERGSVTRAAEHLRISQPAISAALGRLRHHFDDPLLVQHGKQMIATPFALRLKPGLKAVLGDIDVLISTPSRFDPETSTRTFRIMASDFILVAVLGDMLPALEAAAPGLRFVVTPPVDEGVQLLEAGEIDLLITPSDYVSEKHPATPLFEERHVVAGWNGNPLMACAITIEDLASASFISVQIGRGASATFASSALKRMGVTIHSTLTTTSFAVVPQLLVGTANLAVVHETLIRKAARYLPINYWPLPVEVPLMREMIQCHRARADDQGLVWLIAQFRQWAAGSAPMD
jgi:DNA-binding transcriptional LysR family regulator